MSKPLTMTVEQEKADRAASRFMDRCGMAEAGSADAAALRAWTEVDALRARVAELESLLSTVRMNADAWESEADSANTLGQSWMKHANALREALTDCFEWFDARADVDHQGDPMRAFPNAEAIQREHVLAALASTRAAEANATENRIAWERGESERVELRKRLAAAEAKLAEMACELDGWKHGFKCNFCVESEAKLADEVRHADMLLKELNRRQDASFSLTTDDVIADYEAARRAAAAPLSDAGASSEVAND